MYVWHLRMLNTLFNYDDIEGKSEKGLSVYQ